MVTYRVGADEIVGNLATRVSAVVLLQLPASWVGSHIDLGTLATPPGGVELAQFQGHDIAEVARRQLDSSTISSLVQAYPALPGRLH